jgi:proteic killer suppression protein
VRFEFKDKDLLLLYTEEKNAHRYPSGVVEAFFDVMAIIESAISEMDIRAFKSLRFEKLTGNRAGQFSLRLNKQYRLIIQIEKDEQGKLLWIIEIVDYH